MTSLPPLLYNCPITRTDQRRGLFYYAAVQ
nr:MAG TPA: hypothetical protein [Caudoviricetes sp.]